MNTMVLTFHADRPGENYFRDLARNLGEQCGRFGLPFLARELSPAACWLDTCGLKPRVIADALAELGRPLLWVDADSEICAGLAELDALAARCDVAAVRLDLHRGDLPIGATVIWFNATPAALAFARAWADACEATDNVSSDHDVLCRLWRRPPVGARLEILGDEYCRMPALGGGGAKTAAKILFGLSRPPGRKHVRRLPAITAVTTTCRRPELYARTMATLRKNLVDADQVNRWLVIDDGSPIEQREVMAAAWPHPEIIFNKRRGHHESVNIAYEAIDTPLVLWIEDDWLFFRQGNLIHDGLCVLRHDESVAQVGLVHHPCQERVTGSAVPYRLHASRRGRRRKGDDDDSHWPGFTLNPNLHWGDAVRACLPARLPQFEYRIALILAASDRTVAHVEESACRHIGGVSAYKLRGHKR